MSAGSQIDYDALAQKFGATSSASGSTPKASGSVDYDALAQQYGATSSVASTPKQYAPGREFGMDVARGMGLDADRIAAAQDKGGQVAGLQEIGSQVLSGLKGLLMDPLSPITGTASNFENAVKSGSPGQIVGALSSILGGAESTEGKGALSRAYHAPRDYASAVTDTAANVGRNETGNLRPSVKAASRGAGAALGHLTGIPGMELAGAFFGPSLADALIPDREPSVAKAAPIRNSPHFNADAYNEGRAQSGLPQGNPTPFDASADTPKRSVLSRNGNSSESEGRPATWTNERVLQLAAWGDPQALAQARLRGLTVKSQYSPSNGSPFVVGQD